MIFQCPACRELVKVERALLDDEGARTGLPCSGCGAVSWLPAERGHATRASAASPGALASPPPSEPPTRAADPVIEEAILGLAAQTPEEQEIVDGLRALLPRWEEESGHRSLIRRAQEAGALPSLGLRYRRVLEMRPGDEAAKRAQQEILNVALASFSTLASASERDVDARKPTRAALTLAVTGVVLLAACALLYFTLQGL